MTQISSSEGCNLILRKQDSIAYHSMPPAIDVEKFFSSEPHPKIYWQKYSKIQNLLPKFAFSNRTQIDDALGPSPRKRSRRYNPGGKSSKIQPDPTIRS